MMSSLFISTKPDMLLRFLPADVSKRNAFVGPVFILVTAGRAVVEIGGRPYTLESGMLLTLLPSHLVRTVATEKGFECRTVAFLFDVMSDFPYMVQSQISEQMGRCSILALTNEEAGRLERWHGMLGSHYELTIHPAYWEILRSLLFVFTAEIAAIYSGKSIKASITHREELTDGFFKLLHEHFRSQREAAFYADRLCITSKYLSKVVREVTGHVPSHWIADFTVREAKMLLKSTTCTVTQLSEGLNFPNSSFFARYFKRYAGVTPQEYRLN